MKRKQSRARAPRQAPGSVVNRRDVTALAGTAGLGVWAACGILTAVVIDHDGASPWLDDGFLSWSTGHRPDVTLALARAVTDTGTAAIPYLLAVAAGVLAGPGLLILAVSLRAPRSATVFRVVIACWGMLVGLTRLYLGMHWFTHVVGGWLFG